jgi:hypothetical protein
MFCLASTQLLYFKKSIANIQNSVNSLKESRIPGFSFKTRSSGHAVQYSPRPASGGMEERLLSVGRQGSLGPSLFTTCPYTSQSLGIFEFVNPAANQ